MTAEYELMMIFHNVNKQDTTGVDSEPLMLGDALQVIKYLLSSNDSSVEDYRLVKKKSRKR